MILTTDLDQLGNNILAIIIILGIFIIGFIYKAIVDKMFQNSLSQSKLGLSSGIENKNGKDICFLYISNRSFSPVIVESFGFRDKLKETDFVKKYKMDNNIGENQKVIVPSRDTIKLEVDFDTIYDLYKGYKIDKIEAFTFSSLGNKNTKKAKTIRKQIALIAKPIYIELYKQEIKDLKEKKRKEAQEMKKQKKQEKEANKAKENQFSNDDEVVNDDINNTTNQDIVNDIKVDEAINDSNEIIDNEIIDDEATYDAIDNGIADETNDDEDIESEENKDL